MLKLKIGTIIFEKSIKIEWKISSARDRTGSLPRWSRKRRCSRIARRAIRDISLGCGKSMRSKLETIDSPSDFTWNAVLETTFPRPPRSASRANLDGRLSARAEPCPRVTRHVRYVKPCNNIASMARRRIAAARGLSPAWGVARAYVRSDGIERIARIEQLIIRTSPFIFRWSASSMKLSIKVLFTRGVNWFLYNDNFSL